jgi:hypothetical protein
VVVGREQGCEAEINSGAGKKDQRSESAKQDEGGFRIDNSLEQSAISCHLASRICDH